jgi:glycosyltransferase involved in cell wall biosynthesis
MTDLNDELKIITVCYNSADFIENLHKSILRTCEYPFRMVIVDNGSRCDHLRVLEKMSNRYNCNVLYRKQAAVTAPSRHHGEAIHHAIDTLSPSDIAVIVDCDSVFIKYRWAKDIIKLLDTYKHVSCRRPNIKHIDCGAWFSAFYVKTIKDNSISFLPMLHDDGRDMKMSNRYDVGSDLMRISPWKQIHAHPNVRFNERGHIWMLDNSPFIDHMGKCRNSQEFRKWQLWHRGCMPSQLNYNKYNN